MAGDFKEKDGGSHREVEAFDKTEHRNGNLLVGKAEGGLGKAAVLVAQKEGNFRIGKEVSFKDVFSGRIGDGGKNGEAFLLKMGKALAGGEEAVEGEPFVGGGGGGLADFSGVEGSFFFEDKVDVLDAEGVGGTEDGGGVVGVVDVFEDEN